MQMHNESPTVNLNWLIWLRRIYVLISRHGFLLYFSDFHSHFLLFSWFILLMTCDVPCCACRFSMYLCMYPYQILIDPVLTPTNLARRMHIDHLDWFAEAGRLSSRIQQIEMMPKLGTQIYMYNWLFVYTVSLPHLLYFPSFLCLYLQVADAELVSSMDRKDHLSTLGCPRTEPEGQMGLVAP